MFTKNLRFFGQILHPQWAAQTPKTGQKKGLRPLGVKNDLSIGRGLSPKTGQKKGLRPLGVKNDLSIGRGLSPYTILCIHTN
jgi:hypothetical protein